MVYGIGGLWCMEQVVYGVWNRWFIMCGIGGLWCME